MDMSAAYVFAHTSTSFCTISHIVFLIQHCHVFHINNISISGLKSYIYFTYYNCLPRVACITYLHLCRIHIQGNRRILTLLFVIDNNKNEALVTHLNCYFRVWKHNSFHCACDISKI